MVLAIVPGNLEVAQVPQMITLSFNGAVNVDNIPIYQELFAEGKTNFSLGATWWQTLNLRFPISVEFNIKAPPFSKIWKSV